MRDREVFDYMKKKYPMFDFTMKSRIKDSYDNLLDELWIFENQMSYETVRISVKDGDIKEITDSDIRKMIEDSEK